MSTHTLALPGVDLVHDLRGASEGRPLLLIGQPMTADGFEALAAHLPERRVVLYDPRGLGRSSRSDGEVTHDPQVQAGDLHALVTALGAGPVDVFASSGGAVTALAWVAAHPGDVATLVAHEPPVLELLPDAVQARAAWQLVADDYQRAGFGAGMARFIQLISWPGAFTNDFTQQAAPDPQLFGLPSADDGGRDDPLLSGASDPVVAHRPDLQALRSGSTRIVVGIGEESAEQLPGRCALALAEALGQQAQVFPGGHGGFSAEEGPMPGQAAAFAQVLRQALSTAVQT